MTYTEAIRFLYDLRVFGLKLGLENTRRLASLIGDPQDGLRFIHVAGTNGKGSTCALLEGAYRAAGLRVGLFTSPHLISFRERIQVNREPISEADVVRWVTRMRQSLEAFPRDHAPTFFEVVTVMALGCFAEQQCDLVIWETGLGGRLDATNIVTPLASAITNIQFDHEQWLGNTLAKIAAEKAGIIKPGVPVVTTTDAPEALVVLHAAAELAGAPFVLVDPALTRQPPLDQVRLPLLGEHQRLNAALAQAVIQTLHPQLPVATDAWVRGFESVRWPGRLQPWIAPDGRMTLLDGAHNPAGVQSLELALAQYFPGLRPAMILGVLQDKDWAAMCHRLAPLASSLHLVPVACSRTATPEDLRSACQITAPGIPITPWKTLDEALHATDSSPFRLVTGSLYLVGEVLERLTPATTPGERALNEWNSAGYSLPPRLQTGPCEAGSPAPPNRRSDPNLCGDSSSPIQGGAQIPVRKEML
ncbi:MAG TPA: folylpolyglutamate synthase/dihydrofolate synthase family protein [Verrucomicrobiota bacterium]|nr:folylpolyglutamate synthase/dihydrofolate synthase family protein [Verrucomicrobiota bacterium]HNU51979.1 folylpolyglutamate synthase/dihydrofolate synthase family protein [Verrucomicrobiota bacterium]